MKIDCIRLLCILFVLITLPNAARAQGSTFTYQVATVENRVFTEKNYRFPFPQAELNKAAKLGQNPGW